MLKKCMYLMLAIIGLVVLYSIFTIENFGGSSGVAVADKLPATSSSVVASRTPTDLKISEPQYMDKERTIALNRTNDMGTTQSVSATSVSGVGPSKKNKQMADLGKTVLDQTDNLFRSLIDMSVNSSNAQIALLNSISAPRDQRQGLRDQAMEFNRKLQKSANTAKKSLDFYSSMAKQGLNTL